MSQSLTPILLSAMALAQVHAEIAVNPIPASAWAIKSGPSGAVILEDRVQFEFARMHHWYRARIFAEEGRGAAEFADIPSKAYHVHGRIVYPDGREVVFNRLGDFATRTFKNGYGFHEEVVHLVPPGVNADCVVELGWSEPSDGCFHGLPKRFQNGVYRAVLLTHPYPSQELSVEVPTSFPLAWYCIWPQGHAPQEVLTGGTKKLTFHDIPGCNPPPFSLVSDSAEYKMVMFWQPGDLNSLLKNPPEEYWTAVVKRFYMPVIFGDPAAEGAFKPLALELTANLPKGQVRAAAEILTRLNSRIANLSHSTLAEAAALPKDFWVGFDPKDFAQTAATGKTNSAGMLALFFYLLKASGISPYLLMIPDRRFSTFDLRAKNPWQFPCILIGVKEEGRVVWFDPTLRFAAPGVFLSAFSAAPGLLIDTSTYAATQGQSPAMTLASNATRYAFSLDLRPDTDHIQAEAQFRGYCDYIERLKYLPLEAKEQSRLLKERLEASWKNLAISDASVRDATNARADVSWRWEGDREGESGRTRKVTPFPGMSLPLPIPDRYEEERTVPIVLTHTSTQLATCKFKVPEGYELPPKREILHENAFGKVVWNLEVDAQTRMASVTLRISVEKASGPKEEWSLLRTFLGWMEEGARTQVILDKEA